MSPAEGPTAPILCLTPPPSLNLLQLEKLSLISLLFRPNCLCGDVEVELLAQVNSVKTNQVLDKKNKQANNKKKKKAFHFHSL